MAPLFRAAEDIPRASFVRAEWPEDPEAEVPVYRVREYHETPIGVVTHDVRRGESLTLEPFLSQP